MQVCRFEYSQGILTAVVLLTEFIYLDLRESETLQLRREVSHIPLAHQT